MSDLFPQQERDELIRELHAEIDDKAEFVQTLIAEGFTGSHSSSSAIYDKAWGIGFRRAVTELKRKAGLMSAKGEE